MKIPKNKRGYVEICNPVPPKTVVRLNRFPDVTEILTQEDVLMANVRYFTVAVKFCKLNKLIIENTD